ncbi:MAG: Cytoplasmic thioredoxin isoenzyme 2 [Trichoglossum hirsutum]|nr:MAG: Cytoplasmic thioredoxin isoenzyme 2 [Trichoglossum hirsutum]
MASMPALKARPALCLLRSSPPPCNGLIGHNINALRLNHHLQNFTSKRLFRSTQRKMVVSEIKSSSEYDAAVNNNSLVFIDFFATWCSPCKAIAPVIETLSTTYPTIKFFKLDVDEINDVPRNLAIHAMPTFILFKDGKEFGSRVVGANRNAIQAAITGFLNDNRPADSAGKEPKA